MAVHYLAYLSRAKHLFADDELITLLQKARERNVLMDVTGMLLYSDGTFLQVLEGNQTKIQLLFSKIEADPRHRDVVVLGQGQLSKRNFPNWAMGFDCMRWLLGQPQFGVVDFMKENGKHQLPDSNHFCVQLLREFREAELERQKALVQ